jgi:hypothetical protein
MNGPEHYREAERLLAETEDAASWVRLIETASVHAQLAVAASQVDAMLALAGQSIPANDLRASAFIQGLSARLQAWADATKPSTPGHNPVERAT